MNYFKDIRRSFIFLFIDFKGKYSVLLSKKSDVNIINNKKLVEFLTIANCNKRTGGTFYPSYYFIYTMELHYYTSFFNSDKSSKLGFR